jgi:hypothetical protein
VSVHRDGASFGAAAAGDTWDIVVVDVPGGSLPSQVSSHIESTITDGGKVMFSWWGLATDGPLQAVLGVQNATSYSNPRGFSSSDATTLFSAPESVPDPFVTPSHDAGINGQSLTAVDADTSTTLASYSDAPTEPAILATYDGQVLINTFLPWDWKSTDDDADGTSDMAELYANELVWMTGCTP